MSIDHTKKIFRLCYNEACTKDFKNVLDDIRFASEVGFDEIELRFDCIEAYLKEGGSLDEIGKCLEQHHIVAGPINALYLYPKLFSAEDNLKEHAEFYTRLALLKDMYRAFGVKQVIVVSPLLKNRLEASRYSQQDALHMCVRALKKLCEDCPEITFIFEPVGLERSLVRDVVLAKKIIDQVKKPNVGLVLDSCNLFLKNLKSDFDFSCLEDGNIKAVHLMNGIAPTPNQEILNQAWRRFLGDGNVVDCDRFLDELLTTSYQGMISTEIFNEEYERQYSQKEVITKAFLSLKQALYNKAML